MFSGFGLSSDRYEKLSRPKSSQNSSGREDELSRDEIIAFLDNATEKLISKEFRDEITEKVNEENRPDFLLMESQLELLEATGIERTRGQKQLNEILIKRKNDKELIKKMQDFETLCHETCIAILKQAQPSPDRLKKEGDLTDVQVLEFFNACISLMSIPETKKKLAEKYLETQQPPNELLIEMQRDIIACLGFDKNYGVTCLNKFDISGKPMLSKVMRRFAVTAQNACQEAVMGEKAFIEHQEQQKIQQAKRERLYEECVSMTEDEQDSLMERMTSLQAIHERAMSSLDRKGQEEYMQNLSESELDDIMRVNILLSLSSHSHEHSDHCNHGHNHGHGSSHDSSHHHGPGCDHDHSHKHSDDSHHDHSHKHGSGCNH